MLNVWVIISSEPHKLTWTFGVLKACKSTPIVTDTSICRRSRFFEKFIGLQFCTETVGGTLLALNCCSRKILVIFLSCITFPLLCKGSKIHSSILKLIPLYLQWDGKCVWGHLEIKMIICLYALCSIQDWHFVQGLFQGLSHLSSFQLLSEPPPLPFQ